MPESFTKCPHCGSIQLTNPFLPRHPVRAAIFELIRDNPGRYTAVDLVDLVPSYNRGYERTPEGIRESISLIRRTLARIGLTIITGRNHSRGYEIKELIGGNRAGNPAAQAHPRVGDGVEGSVVDAANG